MRLAVNQDVAGSSPASGSTDRYRVYVFALAVVVKYTEEKNRVVGDSIST